jgi:hypothetical protein
MTKRWNPWTRKAASQIHWPDMKNEVGQQSDSFKFTKPQNDNYQNRFSENGRP